MSDTQESILTTDDQAPAGLEYRDLLDYWLDELGQRPVTDSEYERFVADVPPDTEDAALVNGPLYAIFMDRYENDRDFKAPSYDEVERVTGQSLTRDLPDDDIGALAVSVD